MILVDFNGVAISGMMAQLSVFQGLDEDLVRHFILNSLRSYRSKFHRQYGELVLCCDGRRSWRRDFYPYYKAKRREATGKSPLDWTALFAAMDTVRAELGSIFPYPIVQVDGAEADDVIATLSRNELGPHIIVSNDKDLAQLQLEGVEIFSPLKNGKLPKIANMQEHLALHILKGDSTDGVPNVLSDDDTFVNPDKRQSPLRKTKIAELLVKIEDDEIKRNFIRNETLIDLSKIPDHIEEKIVTAFEAARSMAETHNRSDLFQYFMQKRLRNLFDAISDF